MSDLVGDPEDRFSCDEAQIRYNTEYEIYILHLHKHDTIQRETKMSLAFATLISALFQLSNITRMSARVTKCYLYCVCHFLPLPSPLNSFPSI